MSALRPKSPKRARALQIAVTAVAGLLTLLLVNSLQSESDNAVNAGLAASSIAGIPSTSSLPETAALAQRPGPEAANSPTPIPTTAPLSVPTATPPPAPTAVPASPATPTPTPPPTAVPTATAAPTATPAPAAPAELQAADGAISVADASSVSPVPTPTVQSVAATAAPTATETPATATPEPQPTATPDCDPDYFPCIGFTVGDVLDCDDLTTTVEVIGTDHNNLDGDGDGIGCEEGDSARASVEPTPTPTPTPTPVPVQTTAELEAYVLGKINQVRANAGLGPVALDPAISAISRDWSQQMAQGGFFDHRPANQLNTMLPAGWQQWGENIASAPDIFYAQSSLEQSPGHYANMVGSFTHVGIGVYSTNGQVWVTQNFARY